MAILLGKAAAGRHAVAAGQVIAKSSFGRHFRGFLGIFLGPPEICAGNVVRRVTEAAGPITRVVAEAAGNVARVVTEAAGNTTRTNTEAAGNVVSENIIDAGTLPLKDLC